MSGMTRERDGCPIPNVGNGGDEDGFLQETWRNDRAILDNTNQECPDRDEFIIDIILSPTGS